MKKILIVFCFLTALAAFFSLAPDVDSFSGYFSSSCLACHADDSASCASCHAHGVHSDSSKSNLNLTATTDKTTYSPGSTVMVSVTGGYRPGWVRAILYNENGTEVARSSGPCNNPALPDNGCGSGDQFPGPIALSAPAPLTPGAYTFAASWYGNQFDSGGAFFGPNWKPDPNNPEHGEERVLTNSFNVAAACTDLDGDGFATEGGVCGPVDCNDNYPAINPNAVEICNDGIDNDCDGLIDAADPNAVNCPAACTDLDGDGFKTEGGVCGLVDCNDSDPNINPGAVEDCSDGLDNNCNGLIDAVDPHCQQSLNDYDIVKFLCSKVVKVKTETQQGKKEKSANEVHLRVSIQNQGTTDPGTVLNVYGSQGNNTIRITPEEGMSVFDSPDKGRKTVRFTYAPTAAGDILWHATLSDGDPDMDESICKTKVIGTSKNQDDEDVMEKTK